MSQVNVFCFAHEQVGSINVIFHDSNLVTKILVVTGIAVLFEKLRQIQEKRFSLKKANEWLSQPLLHQVDADNQCTLNTSITQVIFTPE